MMGYRDTSSGYDPNTYEQPGPPLRPYNWVQWTGIVIGTLGIVLIAVQVLGRIGWLPRMSEDLSPAPFMLPMIGVALVNSRRAPGTEVGTEQLAKNRKVLLITVLICAVILGAVTVIEFKGA